ncbi:hypothetical protein ES703_36839 [subsurface metagenome]
MKIAISTDEGNFVSPHFGRCPYFTIIEIEEGEILNKDTIENPGHRPAFLPQFLSEIGVSCIITGGMGHRARELFAEKNIEIIVGVTGKIDEVIPSFISGELKSGESLCIPGSGKGYGIEKSICNHNEHPHEHHHKK